MTDPDDGIRRHDGGADDQLDSDGDQGDGDTGEATIDRRVAETLLDDAGEPATYGEVRRAVAEADMLDPDDPSAAVDDALNRGVLVKRDSDGNFPTLALGDGEPSDDDQDSDDSDGDDASGDLAERSLEAFAAAVDFFNSQLDRDISDAFDDAPDTPREYYTEYRGWSADTVAEKQLGYAPADPNALLDHLMREGFDGDAIQGSGLFYEDFTPHFQGRYVLPYFDEDGRPVYAISRSLNHHEDGHPRDPKGDQKYTKAIKTKDRTYVDEPIYGADTVDESTDRLLVAGGIADAITLHEAGCACVSPVTTVRFKNKHEPRVVDLVDTYDLDGVYMLNDAERPTVDATELGEGETADSIGDVLTIKQYGEGLRGAFGNAEFLLAEGVDAYLVRLPGGDGDLRKLDPDDYLKESWGTVETVLRNARHAEAHAGYQEWASERRSSTNGGAVPTGGDATVSGTAGASDSRAAAASDSRLFGLDFTDVSGMSLGDRQNNPFGHHGDSEGYFVCAEKNGLVHGYDHKYNVAYNALSFLLCDAGERRADDPNGKLTDWEVFVAWQHAKSNRHLPDDDSVPYRGLRAAAVEDGLVDRDDLVSRSSETGRVVEDPEAAGADTYRALPSGTYNDALEHVREEYDVDPGRDPVEGTADREDDAEDDTDPRDLLALGVVVEPANALAAAGAVEPDDLGDGVDLPELEREAVDDVAIAVALREGWIDTADEFPEDGLYTEAYYRARDRYGAPLPEYLDNTTLEERTELVFAALDRVRPEHVLDALESEITVDDPTGEAIAKINPTWEESDSRERILAGYGAGFYCTEHSPHQPKGHHTFDALQVVALEHGLVEDEFTRPAGEAFKQAYRLLREEYDAPVPRWRATLLEHVAVLPPSVRLLDDDLRLSDSATETLQEAHDRTEALVRDAVGVRDHAQLITNVPGTGKTYASVATAADRPMLYLTRRNELKKQAEEYAAEIAADDVNHPGAEPSVAHLPILAEDALSDAAVRAGVAAVREEGFDLLRDRHEELYERVAPELEDDDGDTDAEDDDTVDLDRGTCETAEGAYGDRWRVRVHIARALGLQPADLHRADEAVFGEPLPCQCDEHDHGEGDSAECELSVAWDRIRDPDRPLDLLVGSPEHAFVDSATTYYERDSDGDRVETERAVVIDEFPEESYFSQFAGRYMDHATWLAEALVDVDTREDLLAADLAADTWVDRWLDGEGAEYGAAADAIDALAAAAEVADATDHAGEVLDSGRVAAVAGATSANLSRLREALETVADATPDADLDDAVDTLDRAVDRVGKDADAAYADGRDDAGELYALVDDLEGVLDPLTRGLGAVDTEESGLLETVRERVATLPVGGDLRALLEDAVDAIGGDGPAGILEAATTALRGGRDGCRELALFATGGYAHPDAWAHLAGAIADTDHDDVREVSSETFTFDPEREGGQFKRFSRNGARILADKNHHGELVVDPPAFTDASGGKCPVLGLDATGRPDLWKIAIGRDTERRDIHETDAERRRFLRDTVDLTVVQTAESPLPYHGDPTGRNFQEDVELVETVAEEHTGEGPDVLDDKGPAVMSTQKVLHALEDDLAPHAGATVEYESMKGSDALGDHQVAVLLGSQHYGDTAPEKWGLVAGESPGRGDTSGVGLDYGTDVANAYLQYMREDHVMQGILRAGRNDDTSVVFAHTSALRPDLPVDAEGALVSAHSQGTLQVVEAAAELRGGRFTAPDVAEALGADGDVGLRQVQNVLADLRESGYVDVREAGSRGRAYEYDSVEDPGLAEVELPDVGGDTAGGENENPTMRSYSWNFVFDDADRGGDTPRSTARPTIPAATAADATATGAGPPG